MTDDVMAQDCFQHSWSFVSEVIGGFLSQKASYAGVLFGVSLKKLFNKQFITTVYFVSEATCPSHKAGYAELVFPLLLALRICLTNS